MKICSICSQNKEDSEFSFRNKKTGERHHWCKVCFSKQGKDHYLKNVSYYKEKSKKYSKMIRDRNKKIVCDYLSTHPCIDCGEKDIVVLDFDHRENKDIAISVAIVNWSSNRLINEIKKCDVRCANCHRRKTAKDFNWWKQNKYGLID